MRADNSRHLIAATRRRREDTLRRAHEALTRAEARHEPLSMSRLAENAGVSRAWLYTQPELLDRLERLRAASVATSGRSKPPPAQRASEASLRRRLELAHQRVTQLTDENRRLRDQLAYVLGERRAAPVRGPS